MLSIKYIGSGSRGNSALIMLGRRPFLLDAGLSKKRIEEALRHEGFSFENLGGIFLTHEHGDHTCGLANILKKVSIPIITSKGTFKALTEKGLDIPQAVFLRSGKEFEFEGTRIWPFSVPHDSPEPIGIRIERNGIILGIATDIGHLTTEILRNLSDCDILCLESNYDEDMLSKCSYPAWLKSRIRGPLGHLANSGTRGILTRLKKSLKNLILVHLSQESNTPELVLENLELIRNIEHLRETIITVALQNKPTQMISIGAQKNILKNKSRIRRIKHFQESLSALMGEDFF
ncbi:MAG: MBL fold metallo-hydrolase [Candidatus Riflebacteria bacterium]|nr:MBL fold metallo-hydrolase [Candidatus Riflebacteria bacterium]